jgi:hypothetical protein
MTHCFTELLLEHAAGKGVPEQMCCYLFWVPNSVLCHGAADNMADLAGPASDTRGAFMRKKIICIGRTPRSKCGYPTSLFGVMAHTGPPVLGKIL